MSSVDVVCNKGLLLGALGSETVEGLVRKLVCPNNGGTSDGQDETGEVRVLVSITLYASQGDNLEIVHQNSFKPEEEIFRELNGLLEKDPEKFKNVGHLVVEVHVSTVGHSGHVHETIRRIKEGVIGKQYGPPQQTD